jgi:hypothetical protein
LAELWPEQSLWSRTANARSATSDAMAGLAVKAEEVISVENQGWMAELAEDPPAQQAPAGPANVEVPKE